ncbi:MAG TPA: hypothetical protein VD833_03985 [Vicinamibacterales bacterium]|nr:hypothetical protein [Vicinamibacterales bacterium]
MTRILALTVAVLAAAAVTAAQPVTRQPVTRADVLGTVGWLSARLPDASSYDRWENGIASVAAGAGWYWTDHLKTEIEAGLISTARFYAPNVVVVNGVPLYGTSRYDIDSRVLAVVQQYQFYRNVWFHPHLGAGVELTWEETRRADEPLYGYDPLTRGSRGVFQPGVFPAVTEVVARPFGQIGFKAYLTQRTFFRLDLRIGFRDEIESALLRAGVGVDF